MNKRIEQLAEQCGFRSNPNIYDRNQSFDIQKFAELIVRECAWIANDPAPSVYDYDSYKLGRKFAGIDVLKHFGVEE